MRAIYVILALSGSLLASQITKASDSSTVTRAEDLLSIKQTGNQPLSGQEVSFGERLNYQTGSMRFSVEDVSLSGIGPKISIRRTFDVGGSRSKLSNRSAADWEIEIPKISMKLPMDHHLMTSADSYFTGVPHANWLGREGTDQRCSMYGIPPNVNYGAGGTLLAEHWWQGAVLSVPGKEAQMLMARSSENYLQPVMSDISGAMSFPLVTNENWQIACLPSLKNSQAEGGEGFLVIDPDGVKYWFDHLVFKGVEQHGVAGMIAHYPIHNRTEGQLLVTRIEDRFGNYVNYVYEGGVPTRIYGSDGRDVLLRWTTYPATADPCYTGVSNLCVEENYQLLDEVVVQPSAANPRKWDYQYSMLFPLGGAYPSALTWVRDARLRAVVLPDGSRWSFNMDRLSMMMPFYSGSGVGTNCAVSPRFSGSITAPSGATASFEFFCLDMTRFGASNSIEPESFVYDPRYYKGFALAKKSISGPGIAQRDWEYTYTGGRFTESGNPDINPVVWTDVLNPNGSREVFYASNVWRDLNEGRVLAQELYADSQVQQPMRRAEYTYGRMQDDLFPTRIGVLLQNHIGKEKYEKYHPLRKIKTIQGNDDFTFEIPQFDYFANSALERRSSSLGYSKSTRILRDSDYSLWAIGYPAQKTDILTGIVLERVLYNSLALPWKTYAFGRLTNEIFYNVNGTISTFADGKGNLVVASNWKRGVPQELHYPPTLESPSGATKSAVVDDHGWVVSSTDENGFTHGYGYDAMGRLASIVYPAGDNVAWLPKAFEFRPTNASEWLPPGISVGQWRQYEGHGNYAKFTYFDAMWRPVLVHEYDTTNVNPTLRSIRFGYGANGRQNFQSYPTSDVLPPALGVRTFYDALDRVVRTEQDSEQGLLTTSTEYLVGLQVRVTNPRNLATTTGFMAWDQPGYDLPLWSSQSEDKVIEISRHPQFGWPLQFKQRSADNSVQVSRQYVYDGNAQLCKIIEPETGATVTGYDGAGNPAWSAAGLDSVAYASTTDCNYTAASASGRVVNRTYDARNRLTHLTFPDGKGDQIWTYEKDNLPASVTAYNGAGHTDAVVTAYTYNKRRLLTGESLSQPSVYTWGIGYEYDTIGNMRWQSYPTGLKLDFAPNALGQSTQARNALQSSIYYASGAEYFPNGALKQFTYGNGIVHTMSQNARQLPARVTSTGNVLDFGYDYDKNGNPTTILDLVTGTPTAQHRWMSYDGLDRLTTSASAMFGGSDHTHRFTYDALDNMESWKHAGVKDYADYVYDAKNRLTNIRNTAGASVVGLDYDDQGNLANKNGQAYDFDYGNRLRNVPGKESYRYDGLGRRVQTTKADDSQTMLWQYGQSGQMLFSSDWEGSNHLNQKTHESIYLAGSLIATVDHDWPSNMVIATKYQHTDALGSPVALTNETGVVIERNNYEPYGAIIGNPTRTGIGYAGHVMDGATGLTYMQQRYYDQLIGRFLSVDPLSADAKDGRNFNRYLYGNGNPYRFVDPDGRAPNQAGAVGAHHVWNGLTQSGLGQMSDAHLGNEHRYFFTETYGWVDIRHFAKAAEMVSDGMDPNEVRALGFLNEVDQWLSEWGNDYKSGFSPEDLPSNDAGIDFGESIEGNESLAAAFKRWAQEHGAALDHTAPSTGYDSLPPEDPSGNGGGARGNSNATSTRPAENVGPITMPAPQLGSSSSSLSERDK